MRGLINRIIKSEFASPDLEFAWQDTREQDPKDAAQIDVAYVGAGIMTVNEVRQNMGLAPLDNQGGEQSPPATPSKEVVVKNSSTTAAPQSGIVKKNFRKFNPYHDPHNGQFTTAEGAGDSDDDDSDADIDSDDDSDADSTTDAIADGMNSASRLGSGTQVAGDGPVSANPADQIEDEAKQLEAPHNPEDNSPSGAQETFKPISPMSAPSVIGALGENAVAKPEGIPDDWVESISGKGGGIIYTNPNNPNDYVRIMPGNINSPNPWQQEPYVIDQNGSFRDVNGNPISGNNPGKTQDAHIPYADFKFKR